MSLLTPTAHGLRLTEGQAGQAISVSGLCAILTSLFISASTRGIDRRAVLLTGIAVASGVVVAFAPTYPVFMVGRALIGVAIGGFWPMSAATMIRIVPATNVPRALELLKAATSS